MAEFKSFIFFDCMETIVDLHELPCDKSYALWAFNGSCVEHYWKDFNDFFVKYNHAKKALAKLVDRYEEYDLTKRLELIVENTDSITDSLKPLVTANLMDTYWRTYKSKCFIKPEIITILHELKKHYRLAVISNFKIKNGIEELLYMNGVSHLFEFIVTSIKVGKRKPSPDIYSFALQQAGCLPEQIIFVGDDFENDYLAPRRMKMKSILLDKESNLSLQEANKVKDFYELKTVLLGDLDEKPRGDIGCIF